MFYLSDGQPGLWSEEGCRLVKDDSDSDTTVCECDHLTDIAVLMKPPKATKVNTVKGTKTIHVKSIKPFIKHLHQYYNASCTFVIIR